MLLSASFLMALSMASQPNLGDLAGIDSVALTVELDHNCSVDERALEAKLEADLTRRGLRVHRGSPFVLAFRVLAHRTNDGFEKVAVHVAARLEEDVVSARDAAGAMRHAVTWTRDFFDVVDIDGHVGRIDEIALDLAGEFVDQVGRDQDPKPARPRRYEPRSSTDLRQPPPEPPAEIDGIAEEDDVVIVE
jgi:hypothetical protein